MSMSAVRDYLYKNFTELSETQHNIMHATYLVIMSHYNQDDRDILTIAQRVFTILFKAHFSEKMEVIFHVYLVFVCICVCVCVFVCVCFCTCISVSVRKPILHIILFIHSMYIVYIHIL